ncbi:spermidine synthase [Undibacterium sp. Jales W-56]|uniref:spermine/spermidine synthase domain-containing protein n=1 Tax=Undibacterium sp. Jales W-56 TaxID=2897325 RepID=UPI0021D023F3|nr:spermidine synthase [Undibacterium sp. Jales W-56]MCU6433737.1 spermidine synthase [Undibacterium sp. Jales W-56]
MHFPSVLPIVTTSEDDGVRFLHLGTPMVQGAMRLSKPDAIELEYVQNMMAWMLFQHAPAHIVQLGLGSAALTKFSYRQFAASRVTAVELNPAVISTCEAMFALPPNDERLRVLNADALAFVLDQANHGAIDILQVDLYDEISNGPVLDSPEFYQACFDCMAPDGIMTTNVFGDYASYEKNIQAMELVFDAVVWLPAVDDENLVVIAFKNAPKIDFSELYERAGMIRKKYNLRAKAWVDGLKQWMKSQLAE